MYSRAELHEGNRSTKAYSDTIHMSFSVHKGVCHMYVEQSKQKNVELCINITSDLGHGRIYRNVHTLQLH